MQSTVRNSYSYSVFQVSPTRSIQTQSTLSWHSGRGGASKHPNNYSGSHMTSRWLSLRASRSVHCKDKKQLLLWAKCRWHVFIFPFYLLMEPFFFTNWFLFYLIYDSGLSVYATDGMWRLVLSVNVCCCLLQPPHFSSVDDSQRG